MLFLYSLTFINLLSEASAATDELSLDAMLDWRGQPYERGLCLGISKYYNNYVPHADPTNNPRTYGIQGIGIDAQMSFSFIDTVVDVEGELARNETPSSWALMTPDEGFPSSHLWIPEVQLRKGLPFSFEIGTKSLI